MSVPEPLPCPQCVALRATLEALLVHWRGESTIELVPPPQYGRQCLDDLAALLKSLELR